MIHFAVVGTNWITERFIDAAHETGRMKLTAVYSRSLEQAAKFAADYQVEQHFDSLDALAAWEGIDAVYIASPNALHCQQTVLFLNHKKHVICEKPLAATLQEAELMVATARKNQVVLFEAFKTSHMPNFLGLKRALPKLGKLHKATFNYCQYSSRYPLYLAGENPNTFNPSYANGSIMDIGYYCLASAVALWGAPKSVTASAVLLASGVDAHGIATLHYGDFDVTLSHSKVSDSAIPSEIQGEEGSLVIEKLSEFRAITLVPRDGQRLNLTEVQHLNNMFYETEVFADLVEQQQVEHPGLEESLIIARFLTEIRRQTGVVFPADSTTSNLSS